MQLCFGFLKQIDTLLFLLFGRQLFGICFLSLKQLKQVNIISLFLRNAIILLTDIWRPHYLFISSFLSPSPRHLPFSLAGSETFWSTTTSLSVLCLSSVRPHIPHPHSSNTIFSSFPNCATSSFALLDQSCVLSSPSRLGQLKSIKDSSISIINQQKGTLGKPSAVTTRFHAIAHFRSARRYNVNIRRLDLQPPPPFRAPTFIRRPANVIFLLLHSRFFSLYCLDNSLFGIHTE